MAKATILIVEDELIVARDIQLKLEELGYHAPEIASSGEKAIQIASSLSPNLVLMDINLKGELDGIEAAKVIKSTLNIPVVYLTAYADKKTFERAKITDPLGYIIKPIDERELEITIDFALYKNHLETRLKESEHRLQTLLDNLPVGVFHSTIDGKILSANPMLLKILGYESIEQIFSKPAWDIHLTKQRKCELIKLLTQKNKVTNFETQIKRIDGSKIWVSLSICAEKNKNGKISYLDGIVEDITARKKADEELRKYQYHLEELVNVKTAELKKMNEELKTEMIRRAQTDQALSVSEKKRQTSIENLPVGFLTLYRDGLITSVNKTFSEMIGLSAEEIIEKVNIFSLSIFQQADTSHHLKDLLEKKILLEFETPGIKTITGKEIFLRCRGIPITDVVDDKFSFLVVLEDITQRKISEQALRQSEERYRALYNENPSMYLTLNENGIILSINKFGAERLGYEVDELVGKSVLTIHLENEKNIVKENLKKLLKNPSQVGRWKFHKVRKDGSVIQVRETARVVHDSAGDIVILIVCEDISALMKAQQENEKILKQLAEKEKLVTLGQFTAAISHEINNPLDIILSELFSMQKKCEQNTALLENINRIKQQVSRITDFANDILNYVKPSSIILKPVEINKIILRSLDSLNDYIRDNIKIEKKLEPSLPTIKGDAIGLEIVFKNLILNAIEALKDGGKIKIETKMLNSNILEVAIRDNGVGIHERDLEKIFNQFFTTKQKTGGSGLGLTICREIIKQHNSIIKVNSRHQEGTTVFIHFNCNVS